MSSDARRSGLSEECGNSVFGHLLICHLQGKIHQAWVTHIIPSVKLFLRLHFPKTLSHGVKLCIKMKIFEAKGAIM